LRRKNSYDVAFYVPSVTPRLCADAAEHGGGAETQVVLLSQALAERGLDVCLVVFDVPGADIPESFNGSDVLVRPPYPTGAGLLGQLREAALVRRTLRRIDARTVVTRGAGSHVGVAGFWTKLSRRRFVYSSASLRDFRHPADVARRRRRMLFRLGIALADEIIVQTEEQARLCKKRFGRTPLLIRSIAEPAGESHRDREAFLWVGRTDANKQPLEFIALARSLPEARFRMVAIPSPSDPESPRLWELVQRAARTLPNFELVAARRRPELLELIASAVAVVSTSEFEGMPNIFLEAWARGVPALAFNHDPDGVIARHGLGGFAEGRPEHLVELARHLWENPIERSECAGRCRAYVDNEHSPKVISTEWVRALRLRDAGTRRRLATELS
jgi:glycosyltransferase involved in cell wall biosynthesis